MPTTSNHIDMTIHPKHKNTFMFPGNILVSEAFRTLSKDGLVALIYFYSKKPKKTCPNDYMLVFIIDWLIDIEPLGLSRYQFKRALRELVEHGFIDSLNAINSSRKGNLWVHFTLSDRYQKYRTESFVPGEVPRDI